jgi:hypothetical protein
MPPVSTLSEISSTLKRWLLPVRAPLLSAAYELHDFQAGAARNRRPSPIVWLDDAAIEFHGHAGGVQRQRLQQLQNRLSARDCPDFSVDRHFDLIFG